MDNSTLAATAIAISAAFVSDGLSSAAKEVGKRLGGSAYETASTIYQKIRTSLLKFSSDSEKVLDSFEKEPRDSDTQAKLSQMLSEIMAQDHHLRNEIRGHIQEENLKTIVNQVSGDVENIINIDHFSGTLEIKKERK